jgi:2-C-methyl-D-erythritol 4-phosphate cytidylyltransferase
MNSAIIAAAGAGTRLAGDRPKQFLELAGVPIIIHTLRAFERCDAIHEIVVVLPAPEIPGFLATVEQHNVRKLARAVPGGRTRAESVWLGLNAVNQATAVVAIHDAVRPLVTPDEIALTVRGAAEHGAAILVAPVVDTIKQVTANQIVGTLDRGSLRRAMTPQCFAYELLRRAYQGIDVGDPGLTDDSLLFERMGEPVMAFEGSSRNIKITCPDDLAIAESLMSRMGN